MSEKLQERLDAFSYKTPSAESQAKINLWRGMMQNIVLWIDNEIPTCREQSLAFTALEEASMWAVKALSHRGT